MNENLVNGSDKTLNHANVLNLGDKERAAAVEFYRQNLCPGSVFCEEWPEKDGKI